MQIQEDNLNLHNQNDNIDLEDTYNMVDNDKNENTFVTNNSSDDGVTVEVDLQQKFTKIFDEDDVLILRIHNKKPPSNYYYTIHNENYMKQKVGKNESIEYYDIPPEARKGFVIKLVMKFYTSISL